MKRIMNTSIRLLLITLVSFLFSCATTQQEQVESKDAKTYTQLGIAHLQKGDFDKAIFYFNKAIELDNNFVKAYENRGELYLRTGNKESAISDIQKACSLGHNAACNVLQTLQGLRTKP